VQIFTPILDRQRLGTFSPSLKVPHTKAKSA